MPFFKLTITTLCLAALAASGCKDGGGDGPAPVPDAPPVPAVAPVLVPGTATLRGVVDRSAGTSLSVCGHSTDVAADGSWTKTVPVAEVASCMITLRNTSGFAVWNGEAVVSVAQP